MNDFANLSLKELRKIASTQGLDANSLKKNDIIDLLHTPLYDNITDQNPEKDATDTYDYPPMRILRDCLLKHNLRPIKQLACGSSGCVYLICQLLKDKPENCNLVIKVGKIDENELNITKKAGDVGIGPMFIDYFTCPNVTDIETELQRSSEWKLQYEKKGPDFFKEVPIMVLEKLDTTLERIGLNSDNFPLLMDLMLKMIKHGLYYPDLHSENIMAILNDEGNVSEFKLVDFGAIFEKNKPEFTSDIKKILKPLINFSKRYFEVKYREQFANIIKDYKPTL
jgi:hypothetical protein